MLKNFKKGFNGDYGVKLSPDKLRALCELDWPTFGVGWLLEGSIHKIVFQEAYRAIVGKPETQISFRTLLLLEGCSSQLVCMAKTMSGRNL
jgi:hypothetical protein